MTAGEAGSARAAEATAVVPPQAASPEQRLRELGIELPPPNRPSSLTARVSDDGLVYSVRIRKARHNTPRKKPPSEQPFRR